MCESPHWNGATGDCELNNPSYIIKKLYSLLEDEVACKMVYRHCQLIDSYIKLSSKGVMMKDLPYLLPVLEFLAEQVDKTLDYRAPLAALLYLCCSPPLFEKSSEILLSIDALKEYFTVLGYMIACIHDEDFQIVVIDVIQSMLIRHDPVDLMCVKLKTCHTAMESSALPQTVAELLEVVSNRTYPYLLDLAFLITSISNKACLSMVDARAVDTILLRMDPEYMGHSSLLEWEAEYNTDYRKEEIFSTALNILWCLLRSLTPAQFEGTPIKVPPPSLPSLRSLRRQLRLEILERNFRTRNDLMSVTLLALYVFPNLLAVESGLAEDLTMLSVATELGTKNTWAASISFTTNQEEFDFKKLLLLFDVFIIQFKAAREIFIQYRVMHGLLCLINPSAEFLKVAWTPKQTSELITVALRTIKLIVPEIPEVFIAEKGNKRMMMMFEWYLQDEYNINTLLAVVKTFTALTISNNKALMADLRKQYFIFAIIRLCNHILLLPQLTHETDSILIRIFFILEALIHNNSDAQKLHGEGAVALVVSYLNRVLNPWRNDCPSDERLLICVIDCLWECVVWHPDNLENFVKRGGTYILLDIIERSKYPVRMIGLATLVDMVDAGDCVPYLLTWRGHKQQSYLQLLFSIWREEEKCLKVEREDGCIKDDDKQPLMGKDQRSHIANKNVNSSPAILDLMGSVRPKIYSIIQMLRTRHSEVAALVRETYCINVAPLSAEDQVTSKIVENYFMIKIGEVWAEIEDDLFALQVDPLPIHKEALEELLTHHENWPLHVLKCQKQILDDEHRKNLEKEADLYSQLKENRLHDALDALQQLDFLARTTNYDYLVKCKQRQTIQVNESLHFPDDSEEYKKHRTFPEDINVTAICNQEVTVHSVQEVNLIKQIDEVSVESNPDEPFKMDESNSRGVLYTFDFGTTYASKCNMHDDLKF